jgi:hypothetical protein
MKHFSMSDKTLINNLIMTNKTTELLNVNANSGNYKTWFLYVFVA